MNRRDLLKHIGAAGITGAAATGTAAAAYDIDVYVYINASPNVDPDIETHAARCEDALDTLLTEIENSGEVNFSHTIHGRWASQTSYPVVAEGDMAGWQDWLKNNGYDEGAQGNTAAYHMLVLTNGRGVHGGQSSGVTVFPGDTKYSDGEWKIPRGMCNVDKTNLEEKMTFAHEMGHSLIDHADIAAIQDMTHSCCTNGGCSDECPICDKSTTGCAGKGEAIHHPEHTLGTVIDGGKTIMAHRSHTAAECYGGTGPWGYKLGCGVGGDQACGTGFSLTTSPCTNRAVKYTEQEY